MLYGAYSHITFAKHCSTLCFYYVLSYCLDDWLVFEIDTLYFITGILCCRIESYSEAPKP